MTDSTSGVAGYDHELRKRQEWLSPMLGEKPEDCTPAEVPVPIPTRCGVGMVECCAFLTVGSAGFECERGGPLDHHLRARASTMRAKRIPVENFPDCMSPAPVLS